MLFVDYIELVGAVSTMSGAMLLAKNKIKIAFYFFAITNTSMFFVGFEHGLLGLMIQMFVFALINYNVQIFLSENKQITKKNLLLFFGIFFMLMIILALFQGKNYQFTLGLIDIIAAILAVVGTFVMKYNNIEIKTFGFIGFFIADLLYIYIANENHMWFFMIQSIFFLYTSLLGIYNLHFKYDKLTI
jgi:hypothetical protein